jgi:hypothetical protein
MLPVNVQVAEEGCGRGWRRTWPTPRTGPVRAGLLIRGLRRVHAGLEGGGGRVVGVGQGAAAAVVQGVDHVTMAEAGAGGAQSGTLGSITAGAETHRFHVDILLQYRLSLGNPGLRPIYPTPIPLFVNSLWICPNARS